MASPGSQPNNVARLLAPVVRGMSKMEPNVITAVVVLLTCAWVFVYDVYASFWLGPDATVSAVIQDWAMRFPALAFVIGFVIGHLLWPTRPPVPRPPAP